MNKIVTCLTIFLCSIPITALGLPITNNYIGPDSGNWDIPSNWSLGILPTINHDVIISDVGFVNLPSSTSSISLRSLTIDNATLLQKSSLDIVNDLTISSTGKLNVFLKDINADTVFVEGSISGAQNIYSDIINNGLVIGGETSNEFTIHGAAKGSGTYSRGITFLNSFNPGGEGFTTTSGIDATFGSANILTLELAGTELGEFDAIRSYSNFDTLVTTNVAGTLNIKLINGYSPEFGDSFDIVAAGKISGQFDDVIFEDLGSLTYEFQQLTTDAGFASPIDVEVLRLRVVPLPAAFWLFGLALFGLISWTKRKS